MPKFRDESDPLAAKRRALAEQARQLAQKRRELKAQIESGAGPAAAAKIDEPPVWRLEDDFQRHNPEPTPARRRHLARQRQRDLMLFLIFGMLLVIIIILLWMAWRHTTAIA